MKRFLITLFIFLIIPTFCYSAEDEYNNYLNSFDLSSFELLDESTTDFLEDLGLQEFDYTNLFDLSFTDFLSHIWRIVTDKSSAPISAGLVIIAFVLISSFFSSTGTEISRSEISTSFSTVASIIVSVFIVYNIKDCIALSCSTVKLCSDFSYAFFPAFCVIVATAGGTITSFSVNTTLLILSQGMNYISELVFLPITNCFMALGIASSVRSDLNFNSIVATLKRLITTGISTISAIYVSILSVKTAVASRADALGLRSVRFAINSVVPVIGGSISEGLLSIQSYSSLIKTSVGITGIISVVILFLPSLVEVNIWRLMLSIAGLSSELFGDSVVTKAINTFKDVLLIIDVILILTLVTTIISIGILVAAKTVN